MAGSFEDVNWPFGCTKCEETCFGVILNCSTELRINIKKYTKYRSLIYGCSCKSYYRTFTNGDRILPISFYHNRNYYKCVDLRIYEHNCASRQWEVLFCVCYYSVTNHLREVVSSQKLKDGGFVVMLLGSDARTCALNKVSNMYF